MASTIQLRQGDMFARPTDLIVIPCSTVGSITAFVYDRLRAFNIRRPQGHRPLGDVEFELFAGASNVSTYVGYAASVDGKVTSREAIASIAENIARFAAERSEIRDIAVPLLGAGAGGLSPAESVAALTSGFQRVSTSGKVLNIFVLDDADFAELSAPRTIAPAARPGSAPSADVQTKPNPTSTQREPIRVFISYTRSADEHQQRVRELARYLRENGVDARLDVWHLRPGMDLPQWMCNEIDLADRVLIVCNEDYCAKANGRTGGVGWEIRLIQADLLQTQSSNPKKYLPILIGEFEASSLPSFLRGVYSLTWPTEDIETTERERLLREIYEVFEEAPSLGQPPRFVLA